MAPLRLSSATLAVAVGVIALLAVHQQVAAQSGPTSAKQVQWTVLCVGTSTLATSSCLVISTAAEARGQPFVYWNALTNLKDGVAPVLTDANGVGLFSAFFFESHDLAYAATATSWPSALTDTQWTAFNDYQTAFGIRRVNLHTYPNIKGMVPKSGAATQFLQFTAEGAAFDPSYKATARVDLKFSYVTGADLSTAPSLTAIAYLYSTAADTTQKGVAAAIENAGGIETWHWFAVPAPWYPGQVAAAGVSFQWALRGLFMGQRRVYLSMQIDDLFLTTGAWDPANPTVEDNENGPFLRVTPAEVEALKAYGQKATASLPSGSLIKYEWAWNGQGIEDAGGVNADALVASIRSNTNDFWFVTHTFTHPNLTELTYAECLSEITQNTNMMKQIWPGTLPAAVGTAEMVTPAITGLFNGECLRAIQTGGIFTVVGDNSHPELVPTTYGQSVYGGIWTTTDVNGWAGTFIIPRWATNIYFDDSTPDHDLAHFHFMTKNADQKTWTWQQLLDFEGETAARNALNYRTDPYMFHQANVKTFAYSGWAANTASLLSVWTDNALKWITQFTTFPVVSRQEKDMRNDLLNRMSRDACGIKTIATTYNGVPTQFSMTSKADCTASISGVSATSSLTAEQYGPERTVFVPLVSGRTVVIATGQQPTCPMVGGKYCAGHGNCDATSTPPHCSCDAGWTGADCNTPQYSWSANVLLNPGFETGTVPNADNWYAYSTGYARVVSSGTAHAGTGALALKNTAGGNSAGTYQYFALNQASPATIQIAAWGLRPTAITMGSAASWRVYADVVHTDGTWQYGLVGSFNLAVQTWQQASVTYSPTKPIQAVWFYIMFTDVIGTVYVDDASLVQQVAVTDTRPVSTDGRCGFNSPTGARCPSDKPCCSAQGWCGSTAAACSNGGTVTTTGTTTTPPPAPTPASTQCTSCIGVSAGPCKAINNVCYESMPTGECPPGTLSCASTPAASGSFAAVSATLTLLDISAAAFTPELQTVFTTAVAAKLGVDADTVALTYVRPSSTGSGGSEVQMVIVPPDSGAASSVAARLSNSDASQELTQSLAEHQLGVTASVDNVQIQDNTTRASGVAPAIVGAVIAATLIVGVLVGAAIPRVMALRRARAAQQQQQQAATGSHYVSQQSTASSNSEGSSPAAQTAAGQV